jgi:hypothetical protein
MIKVTILQQRMACLVGTDRTNSTLFYPGLGRRPEGEKGRRGEGEKLVLRKDVQIFSILAQSSRQVDSDELANSLVHIKMNFLPSPSPSLLPSPYS